MAKSNRKSPNGVLRLAAAAVAVALIGPLAGVRASGATLQWDGGSTNGVTLGGSGTWDYNSTADWYTGTTDVPWTDATGTNDIASFGGATAGVVSLNSNIDALGLTFTTTGYTLQSSVNGPFTLAIGASGINASGLGSGTTTLSSTLNVSLLSNQTWTVGYGATLSVAGAIGDGGGAKGLTIAGSGTVALSAADTYSGATIVNAGTLDLTTVSGTIANSATKVNSAALLTVDNGAAAGTAVTRTASLTLNGGKLTDTGSANFNTDDIFGALTIGQGSGVYGGAANASTATGGDNAILITPNTAKNTLLNFSSLSQTAGGTLMFVENGGSNIGAAAITSAIAGGINIQLAAAPALIGSAVSGGTITTTSGIVPFAMSNDTGTSNFAVDFVTYDPAYGIRTITTYATNLATLSGVPQNVKLAAPDTTQNTNATVNSLIINGSFTQTIIGTLVDNSGALMFTNGANPASISGGTLQLGVGGADAFVETPQYRANTIASVITGPDSAHNLTLSFGETSSGLADLVLSGANAYAGGTIINSTTNLNTLVLGGAATGSNGVYTLTAGTSGNLGVGNVTLNDVTLGINRSDTVTISNNFLSTGAAIIQPLAAGTITLSGNITGTTGVIQSAAGGVLNLTGVNTYSGATTVSAGSLNVTGSVSGTAVTVSGAGVLSVPNTNGLTGASSLTVGAGGIATLASANNFTGGVSVGGTLQLQNGRSIASSGLNFLNGGTLQLRADANTTFAVTGAGTVPNGTINFDVNQLVSGSNDTLSFLPAMTWAPNATPTISITGGSGDVLALGALSAPSTSGGPYVFTINPTTAPVTIASFQAGSYGSTATFTGSNNATVAGFILNSNGIDGVTVSGGNVTITGATTSSGSRASGQWNFVLNSGALNIDNAGVFTNAGSGGTPTTLTINGGTLNNTSGAAITTSSSPIQTWNGDFTFGGTSALNLGAQAVTLGGSGTTRTLTTSGTAGALTVGGIISNGATANSLTKAGPGTLVLTGASAYTGLTSVTGGILTVSGAGSIAASSGLSVASGATFNYFPTTPATMTLASSSTLSLAANSTIGFSWSTTANSAIAVQGAASFTGSGPLILNPSGAFASQPYTVLTAASGLDTIPSFLVDNETNFTYTIGQSATAITITPATAGPLTTAFWTGGLSGAPNVWAASNGSASNWLATAAGSAQPLTPGSTTAVTISATTPGIAPTATVLGANVSIAGLTIADTVNGLGLNADGNTLTIGSGGVTISASVPASFIGANVALSANQSWANNSGHTLAVSGNISGAFNLTFSGNGPTTLSGADNITGATTVTGSLLTIAGAGGIIGTSGFSINGGGVVAVTSSAAIPINISSTGSDLYVGGNGSGLGTLYIGPTVTGTIEETNASNTTIGNGKNNSGVLFQEGGLFTSTANIYIGVNASTGVYNIASGALTAGSAKFLYVGNANGASGGDFGTLNVNGGVVTVPANGTFSLGNASNTSSAVINLNGGILQTPAWTVAATDTAASVNFNGGTLQANLASTNFLPTPTMATIFAGGAVIDTNGSNITITNALTNAASLGVTSAVATDATDVFSSPPTVTFIGGSGGVAPTGYATLNSSGYISGIVITNAGTQTTAPTSFTIAGATSVSGISVSSALNSVGGLTKLGSGALTLSGANTYAGPTTIEIGTLALSSATANNIANSTLILAGDTRADKAAILDASGISNASGFVLSSGQTLAGFGTVVAPAAGLVVGSGAKITAGSGASATSTPGLLGVTGGGEVWTTGTYDWKLNLAAPNVGATAVANGPQTAGAGTLYTDKTGVNWDELAMSTLSITGAFNIQVIGINLGSSTFNTSTPQQWVAATTPANAITTTGSFALAPPVNFPAGVGTFSASIDNTSDSGFDDVVISYTPAPEPTSLAMLALGAGGLLLRRRRRQNADEQTC